MSSKQVALWASALAIATGLGACGSSGGDSKPAKSSTTKTAKAKPVYGKVLTTFEKAGPGESLAKTVLKDDGTATIGAALGTQFKLPHDIHIVVRRGETGPFYDPATRTINLSYGFAAFTGHVIRKNDPKMSDEDYGEEWAAVSDFLLIHEFGHALIDQFDIPVTGREEDAVDALAAVFLTQFVEDGDEYAFDAANFFTDLSERQLNPTEADYFDEHSLDQQRAYEIVCWIAGSDKDDYKIIQKEKLLSDARLARCPSEYEQKVHSWFTLLKPHVRG